MVSPSSSMSFFGDSTESLLREISQQNSSIQTILGRQTDLLQEQLNVLKEIAKDSDDISLPSTVYSVLSDNQDMRVEIDAINKDLFHVKTTLNTILASKTQEKTYSVPTVNSLTGKYQRFKVFDGSMM